MVYGKQAHEAVSPPHDHEENLDEAVFLPPELKLIFLTGALIIL